MIKKSYIASNPDDIYRFVSDGLAANHSAIVIRCQGNLWMPPCDIPIPIEVESGWVHFFKGHYNVRAENCAVTFYNATGTCHATNAAVICNGEMKIYGEGESRITTRGNCIVYAKDNTVVVTYDQCSCYAEGHCHLKQYDYSCSNLDGDHVTAVLNNISFAALTNAKKVEANDNSLVMLAGFNKEKNPEVIVTGNAHFSKGTTPVTHLIAGGDIMLTQSNSFSAFLLARKDPSGQLYSLDDVPVRLELGRTYPSLNVRTRSQIYHLLHLKSSDIFIRKYVVLQCEFPMDSITQKELPFCGEIRANNVKISKELPKEEFTPYDFLLE